MWVPHKILEYLDHQTVYGNIALVYQALLVYGNIELVYQALLVYGNIALVYQGLLVYGNITLVYQALLVCPPNVVVYGPLAPELTSHVKFVDDFLKTNFYLSHFQSF